MNIFSDSTCSNWKNNFPTFGKLFDKFNNLSKVFRGKTEETYLHSSVVLAKGSAERFIKSLTLRQHQVCQTGVVF